MVLYYRHDFYSVLLRFHGSVIPRCALHALLFAAIGAGAAALAVRDWLRHDYDQLSLICGLVMSLLLTFRLNFAYQRYDHAFATVASFQATSRQLVSRLCATSTHRTQSPSRRHSACGVGSSFFP